jgi:hypothetical protein
LTKNKNIGLKRGLFIVTILATLFSCKVTDKSVAGTYADKWGEKIVLNSDKTCKVDVVILDTVLTIMRGTKVITGQWRLSDNYIRFNMDDKKFKYLDSISYQVKGQKIITPALNLHVGATKTYKKSKRQLKRIELCVALLQLTATNGHWAESGHRRALLTRSLREFLFAAANKHWYL